jgi:hypothetical protein
MSDPCSTDRNAYEEFTRRRIEELQELEAEEGIELPYDPMTICALEDENKVVDLLNGAQIENGADIPFNSPRLQHGYEEMPAEREARLRWGELYPTSRPKHLMPKGIKTGTNRRRRRDESSDLSR